ncbi:hypothetical protein XH87_06030 [Bradyrhizobium sp. CCBAU 53415]|nr:hypothetical protein [Bradyrhizobium sp. CCBAU 53415]
MRFVATLSAVLHGSGAGNRKLLFSGHILRAFWEQCSKYLWTNCIRPDTIFVTSMCRLIGRETGLAWIGFGLVLGAWGLGKGPV